MARTPVRIKRRQNGYKEVPFATWAEDNRIASTVSTLNPGGWIHSSLALHSQNQWLIIQ